MHRLVDAFEQRRTGVVAARYDGHPGAPAILSREHFDALGQLTGDHGARKLFSQLPNEALTTIDLPELAIDIDTPEDLRRLGLPVD